MIKRYRWLEASEVNEMVKTLAKKYKAVADIPDNLILALREEAFKKRKLRK